MRRTNVTAGFTLIELLLYVALAGTLLTGVVYFLGLAVDARVKYQTISEVDQQGAAVLDIVSQTVRNATAINSPAAGVTASSLSVATPTTGTNPTIFDVSAGVLRIKEGTAAPVPITNSQVTVVALNIMNVSRPSTPGAVQISLVLGRVNPSGRNEYDYQKTFTTTTTIRSGP